MTFLTDGPQIKGTTNILKRKEEQIFGGSPWGSG